MNVAAMEEWQKSDEASGAGRCRDNGETLLIDQPLDHHPAITILIRRQPLGYCRIGKYISCLMKQKNSPHLRVGNVHSTWNRYVLLGNFP